MNRAEGVVRVQPCEQHQGGVVEVKRVPLCDKCGDAAACQCCVQILSIGDLHNALLRSPETVSRASRSSKYLRCTGEKGR